MDGTGRNLKWFASDGVKFEIPYFQRPYVWDEKDWENLINGIVEEKNNKMPFIGSIILKDQNIGDRNEKQNYLVIDGQQRLMTLSVLIKAFLDSYPRINSEQKSIILGMIYETDDEPDTPIHISRIKPSNSDSKEYKIVMADVIDQAALDACDGKITSAYKYFKKIFENYEDEQKLSFSKKLRATSNFFISIRIEPEDDEQKIFDSVNSLGKKLTNADIIKNYLYQQLKNKSGQDESSQNRVMTQYEDDWEKVFYSDTQKEFWNANTVIGRIETNRMEVFFKDFGILKGIYSPLDKDSFKGIVNAYKKEIDKLDSDGISRLSKSISEYACAYYEMFNQYYECTNFSLKDYFNTTMLVLDKVQTSTFYPFMLKLYKDQPSNVDEQYFALQKFIIKRVVYDLSTKNYNKLCEQLLDPDVDPIDKLDNYVDFADINYNAYPQGLLKLNNGPATLLLFIIEMIRRNGAEEYMDSDLVYSDKLSLEHIMPKKWETNWSNVPCYKLIDNKGEKEYENITEYNELVAHRKSKINSIGNMTLLPNKLNSSVSNSAFKTKIKGDGAKRGIQYYVSFIVSKEIVNIYNENEKWDEKDIYERETKLFDELNNHYKFK